MPLSFFIVGAATAVIISFVALAALWPEPRLQGPPRLRVFGGAWIRPLLGTLRILGVVGLGLVIVDGVGGGNVTTRHIAPLVVWVLFWLVVPYVVAVAGNLWKWISPWRTAGRWINAAIPERPEIAGRVGVWPATIALVAFTWLELVSPNSGDAGTLAVAAIVYTIYLVVAMRVAGVETGLSSFDAFENYYEVMSAISPVEIGARRDGPGATAAQSSEVVAPVVAWRGWLRGLPNLPVRPGSTWFLIALIGTVTYDGLSSAAWWGDLFGDEARSQTFGTIALVAVVLVIGAGYYGASAAAARLARSSGMSVGRVAAAFVHTLQPIALAYAFAHYFTLVLFEGQGLLHAASDPFGFGWNLFGTANWRIVFFMSPTAVWWVQLVSIVLGHVAATALAHDRALHLFGGEVAIRTQYAMLGLMVALTSLGLFILAG